MKRTVERKHLYIQEDGAVEPRNQRGVTPDGLVNMKRLESLKLAIQDWDRVDRSRPGSRGMRPRSTTGRERSTSPGYRYCRRSLSSLFYYGEVHQVRPRHHADRDHKKKRKKKKRSRIPGWMNIGCLIRASRSPGKLAPPQTFR